jgi:2-keto-4-pentenoate hydratase/2-oxohepta-3-ene-1,7-dioic acid hydratase in catechol pathway
MLDRDGRIRDLSGKLSDIDGETLSGISLDRLRQIDPSSLPLVAGTPRLGPPVGAVPKFIAIGLNYRDHAAETGAAVPKEPIIFMKATSCIAGPNDDVIIPKGSQKTDWEVELGVVIGRTARHVPLAEALRYVAGYCIVNDVSEREFQVERGGQFTKGKSADTFGPIGPWLVTTDEIPNPQGLKLYCEVNGKRMQDSTTGNMIFSVAEIVSYVSRFMTMVPGDVIATGTPAGVGFGMKPPQYLKPGDRMHLSVEGLGEQTQRLVAYAE